LVIVESLNSQLNGLPILLPTGEAMGWYSMNVSPEHQPNWN